MRRKYGSDLPSSSTSANDPLGRLAETPASIPWRGWGAVLRRVLREAASDRISLVAAGCAFYAMLSLFPAMSLLISLYGLMFDPVTVEPQLQILEQLLPAAAYELIAARLHELVTTARPQLGVGMLVSFLIAFWSASAGIKAMLGALNLAYEEIEERGFLHFQVVALALTLFATLVAIIGIGALVGIPTLLPLFGLSAEQRWAIQLASFAVLLVLVLLGIAVLYRFGPSRQPPRIAWLTPGSILATVLWAAASMLFSLYVSGFAAYDRTYGALGAAVALLMWFYVGVFAVLLGAELNAELELQTARDTTDGPQQPMGERGAFVADNIALD
jgi:membrane protein